MDLNTVTVIARPRSRDEIKLFAEGDAYLAGGTWLFSEPQTQALARAENGYGATRPPHLGFLPRLLAMTHSTKEAARLSATATKPTLLP